MARESKQAKITSRIIIQDDRQMDSVFIVLLDGFDGAGSACELTVENVPAFSWPQPDTIAWPEVRLEDADVFQASFFFQETPFPIVHHCFPTRPNIGEWRVSSVLPLPRYICTPQGMQGSKLRTTRMMSIPLKLSGPFSSKMGVPCTASS